MSKQHKIYAAIAVLALLGAGLYFVKKGEQTQLQAHAVGGEAVDLPKVKVSKDELDKLTKVEITSKDKGQVVLERRAGPAPDAQKEEKKEEKKDAGKDEAEKSHWVLSAPVKALADQENVKSLLENLEKLEIEERITGGTETYKKYELEGDKATHVVAFKGEGKVLDLYFGKSGSRGQMVRIAGKDGVWACKGYSSYLYAREIKNWRKTKIWGFEDKNAVSVAVENERGRFSFTKNDEKWNGAFYKRRFRPRTSPRRATTRASPRRSRAAARSRSGSRTMPRSCA
ncbi:MAG: DUF4340 domain-containing protein [Deltaproteobacteria bacterium]|nr:DUF4340 domain-containing protein [Deltaproteobacteria bacterium]